MQVVIALKLTKQIPDLDCDYIGADSGALILAEHHKKMVFAIGDFDSVEESDLSLIQKYAKEVIRLNPIKDDSDSEAALNEALKRGYDDILLIGAEGGRLDHTYYNLRLVYKHPDCLKLWSPDNLVYALKEGTYKIKKEGYKYISFFAEDTSIITLQGFEYPLADRMITKDDLYTLSNSILQEEGIVTIKKGKVLVIQSRDAK